MTEDLPDQEPESEGTDSDAESRHGGLNPHSKEFIYQRTIDIKPSPMVIHGTYGLDPYSKMFHKRENLPKEFVYPHTKEEH